MPTCIEIFCGIGGLSLGFQDAGYDLRLGVEIDAELLKIFAKNHPNTPTICQDIRTVSPELIAEHSCLAPGELDVLLGGPPCQGFSTYGQRDPSDPRNSLYEEYAKLIAYFNPKVIVLENVVGILSMDSGNVVKNIIGLFKDSFGYNVRIMQLDAANFGVPQYRKRVFFVGYRDSLTPTFPLPLCYSPKNKRSNIGDLPQSDFGFCFSETERILTQDQYDHYLRNHQDKLKPALTLRDAITDLPLEVFKPRETNSLITAYISDPNTDYQLNIRNGSSFVHNHSSKQHLLKRQARTMLLQQGDYGEDLHEKHADLSHVVSTIRDAIADQNVSEIMTRARSVDVAAEKAFLHELQDEQLASVKSIASHLASGGFANKYRRLHWDAPSHTLLAHMARDCSDFIHPSENRPISVREAARIQSFPDTFVFTSSHFQQLRGIGNSVPPLLARALARQIAKDRCW